MNVTVGLVIGVIDHLAVITTASPILLITAHTEPSQFVLTSRFLVTDPNNILC
jgi:hypothetical protein